MHRCLPGEWISTNFATSALGDDEIPIHISIASKLLRTNQNIFGVVSNTWQNTHHNLANIERTWLRHHSRPVVSIDGNLSSNCFLKWNAMSAIVFTVTPHDLYVIPNHPKFDNCLRLTTKETAKVRITRSLWGVPLMNGGIPSQSVGYVESIFVAWR